MPFAKSQMSGLKRAKHLEGGRRDGTATERSVGKTGAEIAVHN